MLAWHMIRSGVRWFIRRLFCKSLSTLSENWRLPLFRSLLDYKNYGIEVKVGSNSGNTVTQLLKDGRLDYVYYLKGDTYGGKTEIGKSIRFRYIWLTGLFFILVYRYIILECFPMLIHV